MLLVRDDVHQVSHRGCKVRWNKTGLCVEEPAGGSKILIKVDIDFPDKLDIRIIQHIQAQYLWRKADRVESGGELDCPWQGDPACVSRIPEETDMEFPFPSLRNISGNPIYQRGKRSKPALICPRIPPDDIKCRIFFDLRGFCGLAFFQHPDSVLDIFKLVVILERRLNGKRPDAGILGSDPIDRQRREPSSKRCRTDTYDRMNSCSGLF